jgi:hypothetical protein
MAEPVTALIELRGVQCTPSTGSRPFSAGALAPSQSMQTSRAAAQSNSAIASEIRSIEESPISSSPSSRPTPRRVISPEPLPTRLGRRHNRPSGIVEEQDAGLCQCVIIPS